MVIPIAAQVSEHAISSATLGLGLPVDTPKGGVIRAALAILAGKSRQEAYEYAFPGKRNNLSVKGRQIVAEVPEELFAIASEALPDNDNKSYTVRVALAVAAGFTREQAEAYAVMQVGRPRKNSEVA